MKSAKDGLGLEYVYQFNEKARRGGTAEYFDRDEFRGQRTDARHEFHRPGWRWRTFERFRKSLPKSVRPANPYPEPDPMAVKPSYDPDGSILRRQIKSVEERRALPRNDSRWLPPVMGAKQIGKESHR